MPRWPSLNPVDLPGLLTLLALGLAVYLLALALLTFWRLTHPPRKTYAWALARQRPSDPAEADNAPFTDETLPLAKGPPTPLWAVEGLDPAGPAVIITHGWGSSRIEMLDLLPPLRPLASRLYLWDMEGHGDAPGMATICGRTPALLRALIDHASDPSDPNAPAVVLYGWSLGAEASLLAADHPRVAGLVLEGMYRWGWTPALHMLRLINVPLALNLAPALALIGLVWGLDPLRRFRSRIPDAARLRVPTLALHGTADVIAPPHQGRLIAQAAHARFVELHGAGHNDAWRRDDTRRAATRALTEFFRSLSPQPQHQPPAQPSDQPPRAASGADPALTAPSTPRAPAPAP